MKHAAKVVLFLLMVWTFCFISPCLYAGEDLININTATVEELISLPGFGKSIAQRIKKALRRLVWNFRLTITIHEVFLCLCLK